MKFFQALVYVVALAFVPASDAGADLVRVEFIDNEGPQWVGIVDTSVETLQIISWLENLGGNTHWVPANLPWTWTAMDANGVYDIPENWDGTIGSEWGFLPPEASNAEIEWVNGNSIQTNALTGWGATWSSMHGFVFDMTTLNPGQPSAMGFTPRSSTLSVTVNPDSILISNIPEPGSTFPVCMLFASVCLRRSVRR